MVCEHAYETYILSTYDLLYTSLSVYYILCVFEETELEMEGKQK